MVEVRKLLTFLYESIIMLHAWFFDLDSNIYSHLKPTQKCFKSSKEACYGAVYTAHPTELTKPPVETGRAILSS